MKDLFGNEATGGPSEETLADGAVVLRGFASRNADDLLATISAIAEIAPFRHMTTPGGHRMSVAMTNCGDFGWVTDRRGYRYETRDPVSERAWPAMPETWRNLARRAANAAEFNGFIANSCLINRYAAKAKMGLHQDRDEGDFGAPIVSVSLGLPALFLFGGDKRADRPRRIPLHHGDVVVWGGPSRLVYHGVAPLAAGTHPLTGAYRYNLTFRVVATGAG